MAEFNEEISIEPDGGGGQFAGANVRNLLAKRFINGNLNNVTCNTTFGDPTQFVLNRLREIAFRTAVAAAAIADPVVLFGNPEFVEEGLSLAKNWTQTMDVSGQRHIVAYDVSMTYLACAIACSLLAVVAIVPLFWNPRSEGLVARTFNPLEVAHVFDAPFLQDVHEKDMERYVRKEEGLRKVKCSVDVTDDRNSIAALKIVCEDR